MADNEYLSQFSFKQLKGSREMLRESLKSIFDLNPFISLSDALYEVIANEIIHFRMLPESKIVVSVLAEDFNVSRTPIKMALSQLEKDGFVEYINNKGYFVSAFDPDDYQNFFALRIELESYAARLAATKITVAELNNLKAVQKSLKHAYSNANWTEITNGEQKFHQIIVDASRNPFLISCYTDLHRQIRRYRIYGVFNVANYHTINTYHTMIIRALELGNPDLCEQMLRSHLSAAPLSLKDDYYRIKSIFENL